MPPSSGARFFCTRPHGSMAALIAVDDLPHGVTIDGLPRVLTPGETQGMTSCGLAETRPEPWTIDGVAHVYPRNLDNNLVAEMHQTLVSLLRDPAIPARVQASVQNLINRTVDSMPGNTNEIVGMTDMSYMQANTNRPAAGQNARGNGRANNNNHQQQQRGKKEYCSYWLRHGECDYSQQGCMYKHEMPLTLEGITYVGLRDIPRWYRDQHGVASLAQGHRGAPLQIEATNSQRAIAQHAQGTDGGLDGNPQDSQQAIAANSHPSTSNGRQELVKTPPRGPAKTGGNNSAPNTVRSGNRNAPNYQGNNGWKGRGIGNRNRVANSSPRGRGSGVLSGQVPSHTPTFGFGQFGGLMSPEPSPPDFNGGNHPETFPVGRGVPVFDRPTSLGRGENRSHPLALSSLPATQAGRESAVSIHENVGPNANRSGIAEFHGHASNPSTDGGVKLPEEDSETFTPGSSNRSITSSRTWNHLQYAHSNSGGFTPSNRGGFTPSNSGGFTPSNSGFTRGANIPSLADLISHDSAPPLRARDTRGAWGPVGGPVPNDGPKETTVDDEQSALLGSHAAMFGPYITGHHAAKM
ncbi:uncharacterized protein N7506_011344 [Penicillium brevicompactum]|uniref:uncharacterized protein n=1 Tax=Penicillium brevicompactum TaxID=5074 RepID=UPI002540F079|nr:uncharacterized protein N7506_011344 [Penicillium brevicompactum]KAJ5322214.1 hypothetical protein N7506_011344 [Penicillium brevicompactum]